MTTKSAQEWWESLAAGAPSDLAGLWFGLVQLVEGGWHIYAAGTADFDGDDEDAEWAVNPYAWWPEDRYFPFPAAETSDITGAVEAAVAFVAALRPWEGVPVRGVATGFDDGDFVVVHTE